jgi:hypothetical protein
MRAVADERRALASSLARRGLVAFVVALVFVVLFVAGAVACGAEGVPAPYTIAPDEDTGACPSSDDVLGGFQQRLDDGAFDPLRPHVETILVQDRGLATLLSFASAVLPELDGDAVPALLTAVRSEDGRAMLDAVKPTFYDVLEYLHGTSIALPGPHDAPIVAARAVVTACDAPATTQMLRDLLALQVRPGAAGEPRFVRATPESATSSWLYAFVDAVDRAARNPTMSAVLQRIEISDEDVGGDGTVRVGREAFLVLARLLAANASAPNFDVQATRQLFEDVLAPRLQADAEAQAILDELLDLFAVLVDPSSEAFPAVQEFMGCVDRHDHDAAIPGMLFDFLTTDDIPVRDLIAQMADVGGTADAASLRKALVALLDGVLLHPVALGDVAVVVGRLLEPEPAADILGVALELRGSGVLTELLSLVDTVVVCKGVGS